METRISGEAGGPVHGLEDFKTAMRAERRATLNATCPHCGLDILDKLEGMAYDWGDFGPASTVAFDCPACGQTLMFHLSWETFLSKAEFVLPFKRAQPGVSPRAG